MLRWITSSDALLRFAGASGLGDLRDRGSLDVREGRALAWVACWAAMTETGQLPPERGRTAGALGGPVSVQGPALSIRLQFLRSLRDLTEDGWVPVRALDLLGSAVDRVGLPPGEAALLDHVVAARSRPAQLIPGDDDERPPPDPTPLDDLPNLPGARAGEPLGPCEALRIVRGLAHSDPVERTVAAQALAWAVGRGGVDDDEAATLAVITSWAVRVEGTGARVPLLTALAALASRDRVPPWALEQVLADLAPADLDEAGQALRQDLIAALIGHRERAR
jgi:hypothetical protein